MAGHHTCRGHLHNSLDIEMLKGASQFFTPTYSHGCVFCRGTAWSQPIKTVQPEWKIGDRLNKTLGKQTGTPSLCVPGVPWRTSPGGPWYLYDETDNLILPVAQSNKTTSLNIPERPPGGRKDDISGVYGKPLVVSITPIHLYIWEHRQAAR